MIHLWHRWLYSDYVPASSAYGGFYLNRKCRHCPKRQIHGSWNWDGVTIWYDANASKFDRENAPYLRRRNVV